MGEFDTAEKLHQTCLAFITMCHNFSTELFTQEYSVFPDVAIVM